MTLAGIHCDTARDPAAELIAAAQEWERAGQLARARRQYQKALARHREPGGDPGMVSELLRWIGRTLMAEGEHELALAHGHEALDTARAAGDRKREAFALNFLGTVCQLRTSLTEAEEWYAAAAAIAEEAGEPGLLAMIQLNCGVIANIRGDLALALDHYRGSQAGLRAAGHDDMLLSALNNLGMVLTDLERWDEAAASYREALWICERTGSSSSQVVVEVNRAEMLVARRALDEAEAACLSAFRLMRSIGDHRAAGDMFKLQGVIARERRDWAAAEEHFLRAQRHAGEREDLLLAGEVAREQASLFWSQQRARETLVALNEAHRTFGQLRAKRELNDVARKMSELETTFVEIVRLWGESIESADRYTQGHCVRVARYACTLARAAGMDEQTLFWFNLGALIHDVGKIVIPPEVLNKPGGFTPEERLLVERHPDAGVELLEGIEFPWDVRPMVRFHHERWGGGGYPTGTAGEEIPLAARILAIADVFDALATDRPYRSAFPVDRCLQIMRHEMPGFFDPDLLQRWEELVAGGEIEVQMASQGHRVGATEPDVVMPATPVRLLRVDGAGRLPESPDSGSITWADCPAAELHARCASGLFDAVLLEIAGASAEEMESVKRTAATHDGVALIVVGPRTPESLALAAIQAGAHEYMAGGCATAGEVEHAARRAMERLRVQQELSKHSMFDELTNVYNRRGFFTVARQHLQLAQRTGHAVYLMFADVDRLKELNDQHGHAEGDRALRTFASVLQQCFRRSDVIARIGGDEFAVLMPVADESSIQFLIRRLRERLADEVAPLQLAVPLSVSVGVARYDPAVGGSLESLLDEADRAMYGEKRSRGGRGEAPEANARPT